MGLWLVVVWRTLSRVLEMEVVCLELREGREASQHAASGSPTLRPCLPSPVCLASVHSDGSVEQSPDVLPLFICLDKEARRDVPALMCGALWS